MSSLRQLKDRLHSVRTTRQMTASMKTIALARLKRKYTEFLQTVPFAEEMNRIVRRLIRSVQYPRLSDNGTVRQTPLPALISGNGRDQRYVVIVVTSDEGLSGAASVQVVNQARRIIDYLRSQKKDIHVFLYGLRGSESLRRAFPDLPVIIIRQHKDRRTRGYDQAERIASDIIRLFQRDRFDTCLIVYNQFQSVLRQVPTTEQLIPNQLFLPENPWSFLTTDSDSVSHRLRPDPKFWAAVGGPAVLPSLQNALYKADLSHGKRPTDAYDYEPSDISLLNRILPRYLTAYLHRVLLESEVADNAARLMAMDNATRNADDMTARLNKILSRTRQTRITTDIAEVSAGSTQEVPS